MPAPDHMLGVGGGSNAETVAGVLERIAPLIADGAPGLVIVPGDVNSTLAAALAAAHMQVPVAHLEAGLRSFDRSMPEEVNRVLVDQVSDLLLHAFTRGRSTTSVTRASTPLACIRSATR